MHTLPLQIPHIFGFQLSGVEWVSVTFLHAEFALKPVSLGAVPRNNVKTNFFHLVGTAGDSCSLATMSTAAVSDGAFTSTDPPFIIMDFHGPTLRHQYR